MARPAMGRCFQVGRLAYLPVLEFLPRPAHVLAATGKAESSHGDDPLYGLVFLLKKMLLYLRRTCMVRSWVAPAGNWTWQMMNPWSSSGRNEVADAEEEGHGGHNGAVDHQIAHRFAEERPTIPS